MRQHQVEDDEIERQLSRLFEAFVAIGSAFDDVAITPQSIADGHPQGFFILDEQHTRTHRRRPSIYKSSTSAEIEPGRARCESETNSAIHHRQVSIALVNAVPRPALRDHIVVDCRRGHPRGAGEPGRRVRDGWKIAIESLFYLRAEYQINSGMTDVVQGRRSRTRSARRTASRADSWRSRSDRSWGCRRSGSAG